MREIAGRWWVLLPPFAPSDFVYDVWEELYAGPCAIDPTTDTIREILECFGVLEWDEEAARIFVSEVRAVVLELSERLPWQNADGWREPPRP